MTRFAIRRVAAMAVVLFAISVLTFLIFNVIPNGDPAQRMAGRTATPAEIGAIRAEWGFDRSIFVQYATTMRKVATGDLVSYYNQLDVGDEIARGIPRTISLAVGAAIMWMVFAVALGLFAAAPMPGLTASAALAASAVVMIDLRRMCCLLA